MQKFSLVTHWQLAAPIDAVWDALHEVRHWPHWWKYVREVTELSAGDESGLGAVHRYTWSSRLPYQLSFQMRATKLERPYRLEGEASGELIGEGRWSLAHKDGVTGVRYDWEVATARAWMNRLAPLLAPAFRWNHHAVMTAGGRGLAELLHVPLMSEQPLR